MTKVDDDNTDELDETMDDTKEDDIECIPIPAQYNNKD